MDETEIIAALDEGTKSTLWREHARYSSGQRTRPDDATLDVTVLVEHRPDVGYRVTALGYPTSSSSELRGRREAIGEVNQDLRAAISSVPWDELDG